MQLPVVLFIAGPMAVGKSTFIARLLAGELSEVRERLGLDPAQEQWVVSCETKLPGMRASTSTKIVCHYDILHFMPSRRDGEAIEPFHGAQECRVVTLWAPPATLRERIVKRDFHGHPPAPSQKGNWHRWSRRARTLPRWLRDRLGRAFARPGSRVGWLMRRALGITPTEPIMRALDFYRDAASVSALYESWRELCVAGSVEQIYIDTTDGSYRFVDEPPWRAEA